MGSPTSETDETLSFARQPLAPKGILCRECEPLPFSTYVKMGATPVLPIGVAVALLLFNIMLPGVGTLLSAASFSARANRRTIIYMGLIQLFCAILIVPYCWAIVYGGQLVAHSNIHRMENKIRRAALLKVTEGLPTTESSATQSATDSPDSNEHHPRSIHQFTVPMY